ncbi:MAG: M43 family zinc metalloprotease, partial [bacterium]|nr:M43 family zinc metalloprotease [bacterium]
MKLLRPTVMNSAVVLFASLFFCFGAFSQVHDTHPSHPGHERCSTMEMDSIRHAENPDLQTNEEFEEWLDKLIAEKKKFQQQGLIINGVYQIPIVVHVVHDGEPIGTGRNLSVAAIQSQIDVLNEDFRRILGTNGYNTHPDGADTEIEFCLARRRPDGSAFPAGEDGINRVDAGAQGWGGPTFGTAFINGTIKPFFTATQFGGWDPAVYMNFWSIDLQGGLLGYAQFPTTVLGGMGCNAQNVTTDGVVMDYQTIGKSAVTGFPGPFNEGRTATHEVGHWLGLRHIWGDGACGVDDFCLDTPESDAANGGCPTGHVSCGSIDMIENYMDYTNDLCMNIFTNDQKMRMRTVLENSPIRASLITSDACIPPAVSDASITGIIDPDGDNCAGSITPTVILRNRGATNLTSATINYTLNGVPAGTFNWTGNIAPGAENNVILPPFTAPLGVHEFRAFSELPNGVIDPDPTYDTTSIDFAVSNGYQPDYTQDFETGIFPPDVRWDVENPNGDCYEWVGQACVSSAGVANNVAAQMTNYQNGTNQDEYLYTPYFILPCNASAANVTFDKSYRRRLNGSNDRLRLEMSTDCGATWGTVLYDESGATLEGPNATLNGYFIPTAASEWQNVNVDLLPYVSGTSQSVQFRFRATNAGNGGNLYVDNFNFTAVTPGEIEVDVAGVDVLDGGVYDFGAGPVGGTVTATFTISNPGTSDLILTGPINVTGGPEFVLNSTFGTTTVPAGGTTTFSIDFTASGAGPFAGTVTFGTNDCDESIYDFVLTGSGDVQPPTAGFTVSPSGICEGQTVTYTSTSTGATTYAWTFTGGTPATATGVGPHVVTYATAGSYNASLTVTNPYGSDTDTQTNAVTVTPGTGSALPIVEGFDSGTFAPTGWSVGNGGNQAVTWVQDPNNNGTAPTPGNSASIDFFNTNTSGDQDSLFVLPADFTGLVSAQLTFDKAYARYNATYNDRMQVLVSTDCGNTWSVELDQAGTALATEPDQTAAYTNPSVWVNETIDLSAYVGQSNVQIAFVGISGWGQFLYLDNVNLTGVVSSCTDPDVPTVTATPASVCDGSTTTLTISGNLNDATDWQVYTGSCGGTNVGSTNTGSIVVTPTGPSTTYYIRGEGGCVVPGTCGSVSVTVNSATAGSETVSACDTYTWSANSTTYTVSGTYTATLTNAAGCDSTATLNLTIN